MKKSVKIENPSALKHLYNLEVLKKIAISLQNAYPAFDKKSFIKIMLDLNSLEMKPRVRLIRDEIKKQLPSKYPQALRILLKSALDGTVKGFSLWPYAEFIQTYGHEHPEISLEALKKITPHFTAEWAVRPFIKHSMESTIKFLIQCAKDKSTDVRRWSSEGTRPRLPWGEQLQDFIRDPAPTLPILEILKFDEEIYVRKSVSNHLNDISKDHPELVIKILSDWKKQAPREHVAKIDWIIRRALRNLIKQGHVGALGLIGVSNKAKIKLIDFTSLQKKIQMGDRIDFHFEVQSLSNKPQKLVVDYIIHFVKSNKSTAPKVFKLKTFELPAKKSMRIEKSHHIKKITTREYYSGMHHLEIQINGVAAGKISWNLDVR